MAELDGHGITAGAPGSRQNILLRLRQSSALRSSMLLLVLAGVWAFFCFATQGTFLTPRNLVSLALQTSIVSLAAISAVMPIVTRNFDLSVGSSVAFAGVILALLPVKHDVNAALATFPHRPGNRLPAAGFVDRCRRHRTGGLWRNALR